MRGLDPVSDRERDGLEHFPADGVFARKGLDEGGKLGKEEGKKGPYQDFRDAAAAAGPNPLGEGEGAPRVRLLARDEDRGEQPAEEGEGGGECWREFALLVEEAAELLR